MQKARRQPLPRGAIGLRQLVGIWFQVLFHSPNRGTFHLSLALLYAIGHQVVLSLAGWAPPIHARFHGTGATRDLRRRLNDFAYRAVTFSGRSFQTAPLSLNFVTPSRVRNHACGSHNPRYATLTGLHIPGLGWSLFARRY